MPRFAHNLLNITKINYRVCVCADVETKLNLFFYCSIHCAARKALYINVNGILPDVDGLSVWSIWVKAICCVYFYLVYLVRWTLFWLHL